MSDEGLFRCLTWQMRYNTRETARNVPGATRSPETGGVVKEIGDEARSLFLLHHFLCSGKYFTITSPWLFVAVWLVWPVPVLISFCG